VAGLRIGIPRAQFFALLAPEVRVAVEEAINLFRGLGAEVTDIDGGFTREQTGKAWQVCNAEGQAYHAPWFASQRDDYSPEMQATLSLPLPDANGLADAYRASYDIKEAMRRAFESVDVMVTPTALRTASVIGDASLDVDGHTLTPGGAFAANTMPFNMAGLPAISLPCGFDSEGLPIGLQIAGGPFQEGTVLRAAAAYEGATSWHKQRPTL
jgi:aspartyl-tRNA(Asn)/glutamyl-tRNA(Gln) amidotransferase subunit A